MASQVSEPAAPRVSVILPVYKVEDFLSRTLTALERQTFRDFEVLAVDDGSPDHSGAILDEWAARWPQLRVFHTENQGAAAARNLAIAEARGELIALQDADDLSLPTRLEKQVAYLEVNPSVDVLGAFALLTSSGGDHLGVLRYARSHPEIYAALAQGTPFCHPSLMFRRTVFDAGFRYGARYANCHDYEFLSRVLQEHRAANLPEPLYRLRVHGDQLSVRFLEAGGFRGLAVRRLMAMAPGGRPEVDLGNPSRADVIGLGLTAERVDDHIVNRYRHWIRILAASKRWAAVADLVPRALAYLEENDVHPSARAALLAEAAMGLPPGALEERVAGARSAMAADPRAATEAFVDGLKFRLHRLVTSPERPLLTRLYAWRTNTVAPTLRVADA